MPHFSPKLLKVLLVSLAPGRRAGLVVLLAVLFSRFLPQAAAAPKNDGEQDNAGGGKSGKELYGQDQRFSVARAEPQGCQVDLHLPLHWEPVVVPTVSSEPAA